MRMWTWLVSVLLLTLGVAQTQRSPQEAFMMQYFERRLAQLEERVNLCEQRSQRVDQNIYAFTTEVRGQLATMDVQRLEVKGQVEGVAMRVDRVERDVEYLENKVPNQPHIEVEESVQEQQLRDAQLSQLKKKAKIPKGTDCSTMLTGVKSLKIVKKAGDVDGSWLKDPTKGSAKIYFFSGTRNSTVLEFPSLKVFTQVNSSHRALSMQLPHPWQGTGHVVYNGFLYYHKADTPNRILKVFLQNQTVVDSMLLPGAGRLPVYSLTPQTYLALTVDELGLWVLHADPEFGGNLVITKLDKDSLAVEHTWDTACESRDAEGAFLTCGTLNVVYNSRYGGRSSVQCLYDIHDTIHHSEDKPLVFFPKRYTSHSSLNYHAKDRQLYAWDDGYQTVYKVETKRKVGSA
ncbi:olfactomedin-like protein 3 [Osmerus mordax]|uniref:olfactomedin-like protein 3 n=1 Tax=Osmerus mordax TaxID=8014 RepID=UPI003510B33F